MRHPHALLAVAAFLFACGGASPSTKTSPPPEKEAAPPPIDALQAQACACTDAPCRTALAPRLAEHRQRFELVAAATTACLPGSNDDAEKVLRKLRSVHHEICACADTACVEASQARMMKWMLANAESFKDVEPTAEQEATADKLDAEMDACRERAASAPAGSRPPPPAPAPAMGTIEQTRAAACACTDGACRDRLADELDRQRQRFEETAAEIEGCLGPGGDLGDEVLAVLGGARDRICACTDKACVDAVHTDLMTWLMENSERFKDVKPTRAQESAADAIDSEMDACKARIEEASPAP
jgi:hypothetical protein